MRRLVTLFAIGFAVGCGGDLPGKPGADDVDTASGDDDDDDDVCGAAIDDVTPVDTDTGIDVDAVVQVTFTEPVTSGEWTLELVGVTGDAELASDGLSATFAPDGPLDFDTEYTVQASACTDSVASSFRTQLQPVPLSTLPGSVLVMPIGDLRWIKPGIGSLMEVMVDFDSFMMEVVRVDPAEDTFEAIYTAGYFGDVPECSSIVDATGFYDDDPLFQTGAATMVIDVFNTAPPSTIVIDDLSFRGTFFEPGPQARDMTITGRLDTRGFDVWLGNTCLVAATFGDQCIACSDGQPKCLDMEIEVDQTVPALGAISSFCGL